MLVLSRYVDESIIIGDDIVVTVVAIRESNKVRLGIRAPDHVRVDREEVRRSKDRGEKGGAA